MKSLHEGRRKCSCLICGKISVKLILFSFLGLILYVGINLLTSTSKMSVIVDMSIKMRSNVADVFKNFVDLSSPESLNGTFSVKSFSTYENEREQKEQTVHFQITDDQKSSYLTNSETDEEYHMNEIQQGNWEETDVSDHVDKDFRLPNEPHDGDVSSQITENYKNGTKENQEQSAVDIDFPTRKKNIVDKFGNDVNTTGNRRQNKCSSCFPHNFSYVIQNEQICKLYSPNESIDLIVLITTTHKNIRARTALRSTWLSYSRNNTSNVRYAFLLGEITDYRYKEAVLQENNVYHDIIKEDFVDTYMNLTYKTIMGFKWAATKCAHAYFVMKTDDDMYVNIPNVLKIFRGPFKTKLNTSIMGACNSKAIPIRNRKSKWFASEDSYPERFYPGFCSGTGYVTSLHVVNEVYKISPSVPFFHLEDVYVSLCIRKLGFRLQPISGFSAGRPKMDPCLYKGNKLITAHQLTPIMLQLVWHRQCLRKHLPI